MARTLFIIFFVLGNLVAVFIFPLGMAIASLAVLSYVLHLLESMLKELQKIKSDTYATVQNSWSTLNCIQDIKNSKKAI